MTTDKNKKRTPCSFPLLHSLKDHDTNTTNPRTWQQRTPQSQTLMMMMIELFNWFISIDGACLQWPWWVGSHKANSMGWWNCCDQQKQRPDDDEEGCCWVHGFQRPHCCCWCSWGSQSETPVFGWALPSEPSRLNFQPQHSSSAASWCLCWSRFGCFPSSAASLGPSDHPSAAAFASGTASPIRGLIAFFSFFSDPSDAASPLQNRSSEAEWNQRNSH